MVTTAYPAEQFRPLKSSTRWEWVERERSGVTYRGLTPVNQPDRFVVTSTVNWSGSWQTIANNAQVGVGPVVGGYGALLRNGPSRAHVMVDLLGYYRAVTY